MVDTAPGTGGGCVTDEIKETVESVGKLSPMPFMAVLNRVFAMVTGAPHKEDGLADDHPSFKELLTYLPTDMKATLESFDDHPRVGTGDVSLK